MKIKEFFKNCAYCNHLLIFFCLIDKSGKRHFCGQRIYDFDELNDFINYYGDEEFKEWTFENSEDDTIITFYLKRVNRKEI